MLRSLAAGLVLLPPLLPGIAEAQRKPVALERKLVRGVTDLAQDWWKARPPTRFVEWDARVRAELEARARALGSIPDGELEPLVELLWRAAKKYGQQLEREEGKAHW